MKMNNKYKMDHSDTRVIRKLVLILSRLTCNAIYQNSNKAYVFCSFSNKHVRATVH